MPLIVNNNNNSGEVTPIAIKSRKYSQQVFCHPDNKRTTALKSFCEKQNLKVLAERLNCTPDAHSFNVTRDKCEDNHNKMSTTSSVTYMIIGVAVLIKISIWCCVIYKRQERRRQLLQTQQIVASVNVPTHGPTQPRSDIAYPHQFGVDNPAMMGPSPPAYNEIYSNYSEPKLPSYDEVVRDPNKYIEQPKSDTAATPQ